MISSTPLTSLPLHNRYEYEIELIALSSENVPDLLLEPAFQSEEDLTKYINEIDHPIVNELFNEVIKLRQKNLALEEKKAVFTKLVEERSDALYFDIVKDLFAIIKESPDMQKRLKKYLEDEENVSLRELIAKLESELPNDWVYLESDKEPQVINIDREALEDLQQHLALIDEAAAERIDSHEFLIRLSELREKGILQKTVNGWGSTIYTGGYWAWMIIKSLVYISHMSLKIIPAVSAALPLFFPSASLRPLQILVQVISGVNSTAFK